MLLQNGDEGNEMSFSKEEINTHTKEAAQMHKGHQGASPIDEEDTATAAREALLNTTLATLLCLTLQPTMPHGASF